MGSVFRVLRIRHVRLAMLVPLVTRRVRIVLTVHLVYYGSEPV